MLEVRKSTIVFLYPLDKSPEFVRFIDTILKEADLSTFNCLRRRFPPSCLDKNLMNVSITFEDQEKALNAKGFLLKRLRISVDPIAKMFGCKDTISLYSDLPLVRVRFWNFDVLFGL